MERRVLVIGGTGMLGRPVAEQLKRDGFAVSVMSSNIGTAREIIGDKFDLIEGDVTDRESLKRAIDGHEYVHINLNAHLDNEKYERIEIEGTANVAQIAHSLGVKRLSNISSATSQGVIEGPIFRTAKVRAEQAIIESGVAYSIMRPSWFFETLPNLVKGDKAVIIGDQPHVRRWIAAADFARQVSKALMSDDAANKCFYNLGPQALTIPEALAIYCKARHPKIIPSHMSFDEAGSKDLGVAVPFFEFFNDFREEVNSSEADSILGANETTLEQWLNT